MYLAYRHSMTVPFDTESTMDKCRQRCPPARRLSLRRRRPYRRDAEVACRESRSGVQRGLKLSAAVRAAYPGIDRRLVAAHQLCSQIMKGHRWRIDPAHGGRQLPDVRWDP